MTKWALLALFLGGLVFLAPGSAGASVPEGGSGGGGMPPNPARLQELREICAALELSEDWTVFLAAVAHHESRWNPNVALGDRTMSEIPDFVKLNTGELGTAEAKAGIQAWDRNKERYAACAWSKQRYAYSGGWFGFLPANALKAFWGDGDCWDPWLVFDLDASVVMAVTYARNLMGWKAFRNSERTWRALNRGWAAPGMMDDPERALARGTERRWERALKALGKAPSWGDRPVKKIASWDPVAALERLRALRNEATA